MPQMFWHLGTITPAGYQQVCFVDDLTQVPRVFRTDRIGSRGQLPYILGTEGEGVAGDVARAADTEGKTPPLLRGMVLFYGAGCRAVHAEEGHDKAYILHFAIEPP